MFVSLTFSFDSATSDANDGCDAYKISTAAVDWEAYRSYALENRGTISKLVMTGYVARIRKQGVKAWFGDDVPEDYYNAVLDKLLAGKAFEFGDNDFHYGEPTNDATFAFEGGRSLRDSVCGFTLLPCVMGDDAPAMLAGLQDVYKENPRKTISWGSEQSSGVWSQKIHQEIVLTRPEEGDRNPRKTIAFKISEVVGGHNHKEASSRELQDRRVLADVKLDDDYELVGKSLPIHNLMWGYFKGLRNAGVDGLTRKEHWKRENGDEWQAVPLAKLRDLAVLRMSRDTPSHVDVPEELGGGGDGRLVLNYNANETVLLVFSPMAALKEPDGTKAEFRYVVLHPGDTWIMQGGYRTQWEHAVYRMFPPAPSLEDIEVAQNRYILTLRAGELDMGELKNMYLNWGEDHGDMLDPNRAQDPNAEMLDPTLPRGKGGPKTPTSMGSTRARERTAGPKHMAGKKGFSSKIDLTPDEKTLLKKNAEDATTSWIPGGAVPVSRYPMEPTDSFQPTLSLRSTKWGEDTPTMCTGYIGMVRVETPSGIEVHKISIGATGIYVAGKTVHRVAVVQTLRTDRSGHDAVTGSVNLGKYDTSRTWWPHLEVQKIGHPSDKFPGWAATFLREKRTGSMATFSAPLGKILTSVMPKEIFDETPGDGADPEDEGDEFEGDDNEDENMWEIGAGATRGAPTGGRRVPGISASGRPTSSTATVKKRKSSQMDARGAKSALKYAKTEMDKFLTTAGEDLGKRMSVMATEQAKLTKEHGEAQLRALLAQGKQVQPTQAQSDPSVLNFEQEMNKTLVNSLLAANVFRAEADKEKDMASIEERRQHTMAVARGGADQTTRNQMLLAMGMAAATARGNNQQNWHEMGGAHAPQAIGATPMLPIAQHQATSLGHVNQLALTQQEDSTNTDDLETAKLEAMLAEIKQKVKTKAIQAALMKQIADQQALLDKSS
jgi:hypothetical protein